MQNTCRSPKGKSRAGDGDGHYAQSFASLNLSARDDHLATRKDSYDRPHADAHSSFYPSNSQGSQALTESSLATPGAVAIGNSAWLDMSSNSSTGTAASSAPSANTGSNQTDVKRTIKRQLPPKPSPYLPCEFRDLTGCDRTFPRGDMESWRDHVEWHLQGRFPTKLRCWFCNDYTFDARQTSQGDVHYNFSLRMQHIYDHFMHDYAQPEEMQKDGHFIKHLLKHNLIDRDTYENIINPTEVPPLPGTQDRHRRPKRHRSYRPNIVVEISHGNHHHGSEHLREQVRHRSKSGRRNRDGHEALYPVPADSLDEVVLRTRAQQRSSLHSSSMMAESSPLEELRSSIINTTCRRSASKHSDDKSIAYMGDEIAANTMNQLHKLDTRLVGEGRIHSPWLVESPQSQEHSHVRPSRCPTFTSTPESGSFWLAEYSEDEDRKLEEDHPFFQFRSLAVASAFGAFQSWQANRSEDVQCDGMGESDPTSNRDKGKGKDLASGKRTWADHSEGGQNITESSGPSSNRVDSSKRRRTSDRQLTFACPYTKKDPMSYRDCYKYKLSRIRDVKQHLARCHRNPPYCPRCMGTFETEEERDEHIREFSCPSRPLLRLDGITEAQKSQLAKKSIANTTPEAQWFAVFDIVFPGHKPRPQSAYVDSELLQDITLYQDFLTSHGPRIISEVLTQRGAVTWNCSGDERDLAAFQQTVFEEGLEIVFEHWLARRSSNSQATDVPSSSGSTSQFTPPSSSYSRERVGSTSVHDSRAVLPESSDSRPGRGLAGAHLDSEDVQGSSVDQISFGEELDGSFNLEHGNGDFLSGLPYDGSDDELTQLFMDA